jgi:hypothetical protein
MLDFDKESEQMFRQCDFEFILWTKEWSWVQLNAIKTIA